MKKKFSFEQRYKPKAVIDITALIDLIFLLVVFFMVTSSLGKVSSISINLPYAEKSGEKQFSEVVISVNENNDIFLNDEKIPAENFYNTLSSKAEEISDKTVLIRGDKKSSYETIILVMDTLKKAGISSFTLSTVSSR